MNIKKAVGVALVLVIVATLVTLAVKNAHNPASSRGDKLSVTASFYPFYDFAQNVGGDNVTVINVTPVGSEPHDYEPTPRQIVDAGNSQVFIYSGAAFEPWVDKFLPEYKHTVVNASKGISLITGGSGTQRDAHFWLDPILAERIVDNIKDGFVKADLQHASYYKEQAANYKAKLAKLDKDFREGLANCRTRTIVTSHEAFGYLGKRYNLNIVAIAGLSPEEEPSAAKLAELSRLIKEKDIRYVFFERLVSPKTAEAVAKETSAQITVLDPIEGMSYRDQQKGKDYLSVQRENLASLRTALTCE